LHFRLRDYFGSEPQRLSLVELDIAPFRQNDGFQIVLPQSLHQGFRQQIFQDLLPDLLFPNPPLD
jgi:hypothetical protein